MWPLLKQPCCLCKLCSAVEGYLAIAVGVAVIAKGSDIASAAHIADLGKGVESKASNRERLQAVVELSAQVDPYS